MTLKSTALAALATLAATAAVAQSAADIAFTTINADEDGWAVVTCDFGAPFRDELFIIGNSFGAWATDGFRIRRAPAPIFEPPPVDPALEIEIESFPTGDGPDWSSKT